MAVVEPKVQLAWFCESRGIGRFSPEEMAALLEDGEEVAWIVDQVFPEGDPADVAELTGLLAGVAAEVRPVSAVQPGQEGGEPEPETHAAAALEALDPSRLEGLPLPPGVDADQVKDLLASPRGELLADFAEFCQERGMDLQEQGKETQARVVELHEQWLQTPRDALDGRRPAEVLEGGRLLPRKVETFRREAPKVGRNDPCPCGSGRKYKKCCGRGA